MGKELRSGQGTPPALPLVLIGYNLAFAAVSPLVFLYLLFEYLTKGRGRISLKQRWLGLAPRPAGKAVWLHAASVGEIGAIAPVVEGLKKLAPETAVYLSTATSTGQEAARRLCPMADVIFYQPVDFLLPVLLALNRIRPAAYIAAETELWPNLFMICRLRSIPSAVINARLSDRSFPAYKRIKFAMRPIISGCAFIGAQTEADAERFKFLGAAAGSVRVTGNTKNDRLPAAVELPEALRRWRDGSCLAVAGSTREGEEVVLLEALRRMPSRASIKLAVAPRHPARFGEAARIFEKSGRRWFRYSAVAGGGPASGDICLVDGMGLLDGFYNLADICIVGGSLVAKGGHNPLEPALSGKPVIMGRSVENVRHIVDLLSAAGGLRLVNDAAHLAWTLDEIVNNPRVARDMGRAAKQAALSMTGATQRTLDGLAEHLFKIHDRT